MRTSRRGQGKLVSISPVGVEIDAEYKIQIDSWFKEFPGGLPPAQQAQATVSLMKSMDGRPIPEGMYHLHTGTEVFRVQNDGFSWQLLADR